MVINDLRRQYVAASQMPDEAAAVAKRRATKEVEARLEVERARFEEEQRQLHMVIYDLKRKLAAALARK